MKPFRIISVKKINANIDKIIRRARDLDPGQTSGKPEKPHYTRRRRKPKHSFPELLNKQIKVPVYKTRPFYTNDKAPINKGFK